MSCSWMSDPALAVTFPDCALCEVGISHAHIPAAELARSRSNTQPLDEVALERLLEEAKVP